MAVYMNVNPMMRLRGTSPGLPLQFKTLSLAEKGYDLYTKAGLSVSLNIKTLTITVLP